MNTAKHVALPDLPEPDGWRITDGEGGYNYTDESPDEFNRAWAGRYSRVHEPLFTEAAMRAYAAEAVRVALEDAANVAESWADYRHPTASTGPRIARAIRALKDRT